MTDKRKSPHRMTRKEINDEISYIVNYGSDIARLDALITQRKARGWFRPDA